MSQLDDVFVFIIVIQEGGFSHAAKRLGLSNGLISRRVSALEKSLGITLIRRTTRKISLTEEGELFYESALRLHQDYESMLFLMQSRADKPTGEIRITAPTRIGRKVIVPIVNEFIKNFDEINITLLLSNQILDPIKENIDIAIRNYFGFEKPTIKDTSMVAKFLTASSLGIFASPEYILNKGEPENPEALKNHNIIGYVDRGQLHSQQEWHYFFNNQEEKVVLPAKFNCNDSESSLKTAISGYGIIRLPSLIMKDYLKQKKLRQILTHYNWGKIWLYAMYNFQHALPKRVRLLLDFVEKKLPQYMDQIKD